ncbi:MAG: hypothetical protein QXI93_04955, partial [Candidatus Methanomethylicia archaeon]
DNKTIFTDINTDKILKILYNDTFFLFLGREFSLYPKCLDKMGQNCPIKLYGAKGKENKLLCEPYCPRKMLFLSLLFNILIFKNLLYIKTLTRG